MIRSALSDALDMAGNAVRWAHLFAVVGAIVIVRGMPDTEYTGRDE